MRVKDLARHDIRLSVASGELRPDRWVQLCSFTEICADQKSDYQYQELFWQKLFPVRDALDKTASNPQRPDQYKEHLGELDMTGIRTPVEITQIKKFEKQTNNTVSTFTL